MGIPSWMGFTGPQLVVVSGLFGGNPFVDGIFWATTCCCLRPLWWESLDAWDFLGHNLLLSQASFFLDGILAITKPFSRTLSFFTMEFWLSRSPFHELFSLFTLELWLSRYLSHELFLFFSRWNFGYHEAFLTNFFFFFHVGTLAITKPFSRTFSFFSRWNFVYHEAFLMNFFFFSRWNFGYHEAFLTNSFIFS
jgi:hypothetical protein